MRAVTFFCVILIGGCAEVPKKEQPSSKEPVVLLTPAQAAQITDYAPQPTYPTLARAHHMAGSGMFRLHVELQTGRVNGFETESSTGHLLLDSAVKDALEKWRFEPAGLRTYAAADDKEVFVKVPITYANP